MSDFDTWRNELIFVGNIVQDSDDSIEPEEAEKRFNRYIEMLDALKGTEGPKSALAIFESIQSLDDYGAYQTAGHAAWRFGEELFCKSLIHELPRLIQKLPDWAGDFLVSIANGEGTEYDSTIHIFNRLLSDLPENEKSIIKTYISGQEQDGWLENRIGVLGKNA